MHRYDPNDPTTKLLGFKFDQNQIFLLLFEDFKAMELKTLT